MVTGCSLVEYALRWESGAKAPHSTRLPAAPRDDQGDVVVLLVGTEAAHFVDHGVEQRLGIKMVVAAKDIEQALLAEFFARGTEGFGDAVGIQRERVAGAELAFVKRAIPFSERAHDSGRGREAMDGIVGAEKKWREMAAVGIAEAARGVVEFGEEERGERGVGSIFAEELIDRAKQPAGIGGHDALAAQVGLQIGHEKRRGNAFAGDVADDQADAFGTKGQEIVVVAADMACLMADSGKFQTFQAGKRLREEARLDLLGDFKFLGGTAFGFELFRGGAALFFDPAGDVIEAEEQKGIAVDITKRGEDAAPDGASSDVSGLWRIGRMRMSALLNAAKAGIALEAHAASGPIAEFGENVFGDEGDRAGVADELELRGIGIRLHEDEIRRAVGRGHYDKAAINGFAGVESEGEAELVDIEIDAALEVADKKRGGLQAQVRVGAVQANGIGRGGHRQAL